MSGADKEYIKRYAKRASFEMAMDKPHRYESTTCYLVGAIALVREDREWKCSHAGTGMGMPGVFGRTLVEAVRVARSIDTCIPWAEVRRTKTIGVVSGFTRERKQTLHATALSFRHISERAAAIHRSVPA
jgi:hypothetical protein